MIAIGLISGTSLDGIDAALVDVAPRGDRYTVDLKRFITVPYEEDVRRALAAALPPNAGSVALAAELHRAIGEAFGRAALAVAGSERVGYVASHGQTVWHDGARRVTLQVGDAFAIREAVGATVCYDFRSADCAAGGHGAPLVPYADALLFADASENRVAVNIGGIANVTVLGAGASLEAVVGYDTGPGNMLLDALVRERTDGAEAFDRDGVRALAGSADAELLELMLADEYFAQPPPKTTGRERFGTQFLQRYAERLARLDTPDALATLCDLTAATIAQAVESAGLYDVRTIVSGGGAHNAALLSRLKARLPRARVELSDAMGVPADAKEAMAFALLGYETLRGRPANVPRVTGASRRVVLGAIAPYGLASLLEEMEST